MNSDEPFQHLRLLHRQTCLNEAEKVAVETSLYLSSVTGCYTLEQVVHGRHEPLRSFVSLSAAIIAALMPVFEEIMREEGEVG